MNTSVRTNATPAKKQAVDVYKEVTKRIVMRLSEGDIPWRKPWNAPFKEDIINYKSRKAYNGINRFILSQPGEYLTFNQCKEAGGHIVKGAKGNLIVKYGFFVPKEDKQKAEQLKKEGKDISHLEIPYLKHDWVYHISQTEGVKSLCQTSEAKPALNPVDLADFIVEQFCKSQGVILKEENVDYCNYDEIGRTITIPLKNQFRTEEEWYDRVFALLVQVSVEDARPAKTAESAKVNQIKEELVIEIGASMILNAVGLTRQEASENTQAKCQEWIAQMNRDTRLIVSASSQAEKIARKITSPLFGENEDTDNE